MDKISIIVPIYNVERYLEKCIQSLVSQSFINLEIILINDGSTDNCINICKKYEEIDKRIKIIDKINEGVSATRNKGLAVATGDFIAFVDPDDWIDKNMLENMHSRLVKNSGDICICNYYKEIGEKRLKEEVLTDKGYINNIELINRMVGVESIGKEKNNIMGSVCRFLFRKETIDNLRFKENFSMCEDLLFCLKAVLISKKIYVDNQPYYHYRIREGSATNTYDPELYDKYICIRYEIEKFILMNHIGETALANLKNRDALWGIDLLLNISKKNNHINKEKTKEIKNVLENKNIHESFARAIKFELSIPKKIVAFLFLKKSIIGLYAYMYIYNFVREKL